MDRAGGRLPIVCQSSPFETAGHSAGGWRSGGRPVPGNLPEQSLTDDGARSLLVDSDAGSTHGRLPAWNHFSG
jgi:hypothetical protein